MSVLIVFVLHSYRNGSARSLVESFTHEAKELGIYLGNGEAMVKFQISDSELNFFIDLKHKANSIANKCSDNQCSKAGLASHFWLVQAA